MLNYASVFGLNLCFPAPVLHHGWNLIYPNSLTLSQMEEKLNAHVFPFWIIFLLFFNKQYGCILSHTLGILLFLLLPKIKGTCLLTSGCSE